MVLNLVLGRAGGRSVALQGRAGPPEPESELELSLRPAAQWPGVPGTCPVLLCPGPGARVPRSVARHLG